jgi:hypothetical protein
MKTSNAARTYIGLTGYCVLLILFASTVLSASGHETYELPYINTNSINEYIFKKFIVGMSEQEILKTEEGYTDDQRGSYECGRFRKRRIVCVRMTRESPSSGTVDVIVASRPYAAPLPAIGYASTLSEANTTSITRYLGIQRFDSTRNKRLPPANYGWADLRDVIDGNSVLDAWTQLATSGARFACGPHYILHASGRREMEPAYCTRFIFARVIAPVGPVNGIAACSVYGKSEVPFKCRLIFLDLRDRRVVMAAKTYQHPIYNTFGETDFYLEIPGKAGRENSSNTNTLIRLALSNAPFSLEVENEGEDINGSSGQSYSALLQKWTKQHVHVHIDEKSNSLKLSVATSLWVSSQNSADPSDWHEPSGPQSSDYRRALVSSFKTNLSQICPKGSWSTDSATYRLSCPYR